LDRSQDEVRTVIRHSVFFVWNDAATDAERLRVREQLAYVSYAAVIQALDFGEDLGIGSPSNFGLALSHDHLDRAAWDAYNEEPTHHRVGEHIKTLTDPPRAARVDWIYDGPRSRRGLIRHSAMYFWRDGVTDDQKAGVFYRLMKLRTEVPSVRLLAFAEDLGWYPPNYHWIVEAHFDDVEGAQAFLKHPAQRDAAALIDEVTQAERTAAIQHRMMAG
jgi:hypothetical protein